MSIDKFINMNKKYKYMNLKVCCLVACIGLFAACAEKPFDELSNTATKKWGNGTTTISIIDATAGVNLPKGREQSRAAVTMDDMFRLTEDNDFLTDAYIIKADDKEMDNNQRKIGHLTIKWNNKTKTANGYNLRSYQPDINVQWLNNNGEDITNGDWYICGIVGGTPEDGNKIAFGYPTANVMNADTGEGKRKFNVPFVSKWIKVTIKNKNKISFKGMCLEPQGVVFKVKVKRNEKLVPAKDHRYMFASTALSPNGYFSFSNLLMSEVNRISNIAPQQKRDIVVSHNTNPKDFWIWNHAEDEKLLIKNDGKWGGKLRPQYKTKHEYGSSEFRYRYTFDGTKSSTAEDVFFVWGMPMNGGIIRRTCDMKNENSPEVTKLEWSYLDENHTTITAAKGGFMLGWLGSDGRVKREFVVGKKVSSECTEINENEWSEKYNGKVIDVNLKVMRPGDSRYKWRIPLERMAKTNVKVKAPWEFTGNVTPEAGDGNFRQQLDGGDREKHSIATLARHKESDLPNGYHFPGMTELAAAFPYFNRRFNEDWMPNKAYEKDLYACAYVTTQDKLTPQGRDSEIRLEGNFSEWLRLGDKPEDNVAFNSVFKVVDLPHSGIYTQQTKKVFYSIRFMHKLQKDDGSFDENANAVGNRYCCAYRYVIHNGDRNNDNKGTRMSITARWLGNLPIGIDEVATEDFWNNNNSLDVVRIFNRDGQIAKGHQWGIPYASKTNRYVTGLSDAARYEESGSITVFYRVFDTNGFYRQADSGKMIEGRRTELPIRCISNWDLPENDEKAPRNQKIADVNGMPAEKYYE